MKIANVAIQTMREEFVSETRKTTRTFVRVVPVEIASVLTEAVFIPPTQEIYVDTHDMIANIAQSVQPDANYYKDVKPANLQPAQKFEFSQRKFSICAVVALASGTIHSHDAYRQDEPYGPQLALIPIWGEIELPAGAKFAGLIECEGYVVSAYDLETNQIYRLGYRFKFEDQVNWLGEALTRRKHWKRSEKDDTVVEKPRHSSYNFATSDETAIAQIGSKFGTGTELPNGKISFNVPSFEAFEQCEAIERDVVRRRQEAVSKNDIDALEALP